MFSETKVSLNNHSCAVIASLRCGLTASPRFAPLRRALKRANASAPLRCCRSGGPLKGRRLRMAAYGSPTAPPPALRGRAGGGGAPCSLAGQNPAAGTSKVWAAAGPLPVPAPMAMPPRHICGGVGPPGVAAPVAAVPGAPRRGPSPRRLSGGGAVPPGLGFRRGVGPFVRCFSAALVAVWPFRLVVWLCRPPPPRPVRFRDPPSGPPGVAARVGSAAAVSSCAGASRASLALRPVWADLSAPALRAPARGGRCRRRLPWVPCRCLRVLPYGLGRGAERLFNARVLAACPAMLSYHTFWRVRGACPGPPRQPLNKTSLFCSILTPNNMAPLRGANS